MWLTGEFCDAFKVTVVVQDFEAVEFGCRGNNQIDARYRSVPAIRVLRKHPLHFSRATPCELVHGDVWDKRQFELAGDVFVVIADRAQELKHDRVACDD
jgi:hypothetical protein